MFTKVSIRGVQLDAAGLVALADLRTIARRTALIGSASSLDVLYLAPGIHCQQAASEINGGEYPPSCSMRTGYVFRIENPATVSFLQRVSKSGHLTTVHVSQELTRDFRGLFGELFHTEPVASALFLLGITVNVCIIGLLGAIRDWWALAVLGMLMIARFVNVVVIKLRQDKDGFKGTMEKEDKEDDLLVILSQGRWVHMKGQANDVKVVSAGQWLREMETLESFAVSFATLLVYGSAALAGNASTIGGLLIACLLLVSAGILGLANAATQSLHMFGRTVRVEGQRKRYTRRMKMAKRFMKEFPNREWAEGMGLIKRGQFLPDDFGELFTFKRAASQTHRCAR